MNISQVLSVLRYKIKKWKEERKRQKHMTLYLFDKGLNAGKLWDEYCMKCEHFDNGEGPYCAYWDEPLEGEYHDWYERHQHRSCLESASRCSQCGASEEFELDGFQSEKERRKFVWNWAWHTARGYKWKWNSKKKKGEWIKEVLR